MKLYNTTPIYEDELLYSWQKRLADLNGYEGRMNNFVFDYLYPDARQTYPGTGKRIIAHLFKDGQDAFIPFAKTVLGKDFTLELAASIYQKTTLFPALAPFFTKTQQILFTHNALARPQDIGRRINGSFKNVLHCPKCDAESDPYIHRSHVIPGVNLCWKHACPLLNEKGQSVKGVSKDFNVNLRYSKFAHDLLSLPVGTDWHATRKFLAKLIATYGDSFYKDVLPHYTDAISSYIKSAVVAENSWIKTLYAIAVSGAATNGDVSRLMPLLKNDTSSKYIASLWQEEPIVLMPTRQKIYSEEILVNIMKQIVGDEYTLVSYKDNREKKAVIRHNICGNAKEYHVSNFLIGTRCPDCTQKIKREDKLADYIKEMSSSRYLYLETENNDLSLFEDTVEGRKLLLPVRYMLQELKRPTPSIFLPCKINDKELTLSVWKQNLNVLRKNFSKEDVIFVDDAAKLPGFQNHTSSSLKWIMSHGELKKIAFASYAFPEATLDAKDAFLQKYVECHGKHIGYLTYKSFAHEIGILKTQPDTIYVVSNDITSRNMHLANNFGFPFETRPPITNVDNSNYQILQLLDNLVVLHRISDLSKKERTDVLKQYVLKIGITREQLEKYISFYPGQSRHRIEIRIAEIFQ
ncbi:MAG: TniQ family protein [Erysipelotrichaceae bacterium]|nr:TniQ family protein [Erysipelotrichaceae bacterium]